VRRRRRVRRRYCRLDQNQEPWSTFRLNERRNRRVGRVFGSVLAVMYNRYAAWLALRNRGLAFFDSRPAGFGAIQERGRMTHGLGATVAGQLGKRRVDVAEFSLRRIAIEVNERNRSGQALPHWLYENVQAHQSRSLVR